MQKVTSYESGKIKVVWLADDPNKIYSKMFETIESAEKFAKGKKYYLIFALETQHNMEEFSWKLLPYGRHKIYFWLVKLFHILPM